MQPTMSPLDVVVLLKIISKGDTSWTQLDLSDELYISQSEISKSIGRSKFARLLDHTGKKVNRLALMDFLQWGIAYAFPQQPGAVVRGIPTSHSAAPLGDIIQSTEAYVWPSGKGKVRGQSIHPLYSSVLNAIKIDEKLYKLLALVDALRVGRTREKEIAIKVLKSMILDE